MARTIPCITLILGGNLAQVQLRKSVLKRMVIITIVCIRYVILPLIGMAVVHAAYGVGFFATRSIVPLRADDAVRAATCNEHRGMFSDLPVDLPHCCHCTHDVVDDIHARPVLRLRATEQPYNNYKVPDDLRIKFINAVFNGNSRILDHKRELKVQARKEAEKFWIEAAATAKKAQALQDLEERYKQQFIKPSYVRQDIPEHMQEYFLRVRKIGDKTYLEFKNNIVEKFAIRNHEMQLKFQAWEKTQQFRIEMMADKRAAKKVKVLQDMEGRYVQDFMNMVERLDVPDYIKQGYFQEYKVPDDIRLRYINDIEEKFRMLDHLEECKVHIWENFKKLKIPLTKKRFSFNCLSSTNLTVLLFCTIVHEDI
uniref:Uncharacterized protein n=1 Tax=Oryza punctata TaxID=4537 RepID=A0A0E0M3W9_ORYPU